MSRAPLYLLPTPDCTRPELIVSAGCDAPEWHALLRLVKHLQYLLAPRGTRPDLIVLTGSDALAGAILSCVAPSTLGAEILSTACRCENPTPNPVAR